MSKHVYSTLKPVNFVKEGFKKYGNPRAFYKALKEHIHAGEGLTAQEWDWYRSRQKEWEPDQFVKDRKRSDDAIAMKFARTLSTADLRSILGERENIPDPADPPFGCPP